MTQDVTPTSLKGDRLNLENQNTKHKHKKQQKTSGSIASGAAKGILYSLIETLGTFVGDPDLPEHARSGYEGLLEAARELRAKLEH